MSAFCCALISGSSFAVPFFVATALSFAGVASAVVMMAAPLAVLKHVVETESTAALPLAPSVMVRRSVAFVPAAHLRCGLALLPRSTVCAVRIPVDPDPTPRAAPPRHPHKSADAAQPPRRPAAPPRRARALAQVVLNASAWLGYGALVVHNRMVWGPNLLGLAAGLVQLACYAVYGLPPSGSGAAASHFKASGAAAPTANKQLVLHISFCSFPPLRA